MSGQMDSQWRKSKGTARDYTEMLYTADGHGVRNNAERKFAIASRKGTYTKLVELTAKRDYVPKVKSHTSCRVVAKSRVLRTASR